jgi:hypothetical protein
MQRRTLWATFLLALAASAGAQDGGKDRPATPEEAVQRIAAAFRAGDVEAILNQITDPLRTFHRAHGEAVLGREAFDRALDEKFGKAKSPAAPSFKESLQAIRRVQIQSRRVRPNGSVELTVWLTEEARPGKPRILEQQWTAVKDAQGWGLEVPVAGGAARKVATIGPDGKEAEVWKMKPPAPPDPRELEYVRAIMPKYRALLEKATARVREGAYKTRAEAEQALAAARRAFQEANPPPKLEKRR